MNYLLLLLSLTFSFGASAQKSLSFKISEVDIVHIDGRYNEFLKVVVGDVVVVEKFRIHINDRSYDEVMKYIKAVTGKLASYKSIYPNGIVTLKIDKNGRLKYTDNIKDVFTLKSTGLPVKKVAGSSKKDLALITELQDEIERLKIDLINNKMDMIKLESDLSHSIANEKDDKKILAACITEKETIEVAYSNIKSSQEAFDVAINSQGSKKLVSKYNEIKSILAKVTQD